MQRCPEALCLKLTSHNFHLITHKQMFRATVLGKGLSKKEMATLTKMMTFILFGPTWSYTRTTTITNEGLANFFDVISRAKWNKKVTEGLFPMENFLFKSKVVDGKKVSELDLCPEMVCQGFEVLAKLLEKSNCWSENL